MENLKTEKIKIPLIDVREVGFVKDLKQGIVKVEGLPSCVYGQLVRFDSGSKGFVMGFNMEEVLVVILGTEGAIAVGETVTSLAELLTVPVGDNFLGRIVDSLCQPLDKKGEIFSSQKYSVFKEAPGVMEREPIEEPLATGIKIIDLAIPIGRGQRELIIGDRQTGKTSIGIDAIINQKGKDVICIYCWIGGPHVALQKVISTLAYKEALKYTIIVSAAAETSAAEQYLAPYTASALGEYFMEQGKHVLVVFDDLTKHAWIYRQMSLLLERSPGREAYPGDIFFLHSQLLERAGKLKKERGGGSMTFLPIVETLQGDISGYIQTNTISITDGQIYINTVLFKEGFKPAIDLGLSVSRVGSKVQCAAIREVSKGLRLEYSQYREMLRLTKMRTHLSQEAKEKMRRGETLHELLIQPNEMPVSVEEEIVLFYAFQRGILDSLLAPTLQKFVNEFFSYVRTEDPALVQTLKEKTNITSSVLGTLTIEIKKGLDQHFIDYFKKLKVEITGL